MTDEPKDASAPFDAVAEAKRLLRSARAAALATLTQPEGNPFASLVNIATAADGSPILLLSRLAAHTRHLDRDSRMSLLLYSALNEPSGGDPLTHARMTIVGHAERVHEPEQQALRARFLARHPKSGLYAGFADFGFFRVTIEAAHLNGGFGRAANLSADAISTTVDDAADFIAEETELIAQIEGATPEAANELAKAHGGSGAEWHMVGFDPEGLDICDGERLIRIPFTQRVVTVLQLQETLAALLAESRSKAPP